MLPINWKDAPNGTTHALMNAAGEIVFARKGGGGFFEPKRNGAKLKGQLSVLRSKPRGHVQYQLDLRTGMDLEQWLDANAHKYTLIEAAEEIGYGSATALRMWVATQVKQWGFKPDKAGGKPFSNTKMTLDKLQRAVELRATGETWDEVAEVFQVSSVALRQAVYRNRRRGLLVDPDWPEDRRIDQIGREGNDGEIYEALPDRYPTKRENSHA